jgi:hypothetical protein
MTIIKDRQMQQHAGLFLEDKNPPAVNVVRKYNPSYALAAFVMGCLIQEQVVELSSNESDAMSDLQAGIRIIAACLKDYTIPEDHPKLPFDW